MFDEDLNKLLNEAYDHLWNGRYRLALNAAEKVFQSRPDDSDAAICYAWALLENGNPAKAMEFANLAVELKGDSVKARVYRAYLLYRMSIFEGAIADLNQSIDKQKESLAWSYLNKAKSLAGLQKFEEANEALDLALIIDNGQHPNWKEIRKLLLTAQEIKVGKKPINTENIDLLLSEAEHAIKSKEYWHSLFIAREVLKKSKSELAEIIELESMFYLFQIKPALKKAETLSSRLKKNEKFEAIMNTLKRFSQLEQEQQTKSLKITRITKDLPAKTLSTHIVNFRFDAVYYPNEYIDIFSAKLFDIDIESKINRRNYLKQFDSDTKNIGVEVIFNNPFYKKIEKKINNCSAVWYLNDFEIFRNNFQLTLQKDWDSIIFVQVCGSDQKNFWKQGQAKVEIYIENFKVCEKYFVIAKEPVEEIEDRLQAVISPQTDKQIEKIKAPVSEPRKVRPLNELLDELNGFIGLTSIKEAVKNYIFYLEFLKERKRFGLKTEENITINAVFLGNPGTGKTTIARMLGDIFYAMGILQSGHVVEVDRSGLVGQYIGETAQKTEKIINDAVGGILFIDEAYTLVKKGTTTDFGQEAIDILLKRMEDRKGEFVVIVAGYPEEMYSFLNSNPGLKSRFSHTFIFDDYTPDELISIFDQLLKKEDYAITDSAKEILKKEFISLYRLRDKSFGNARLVKKIFEAAKLNLSKSCLLLPEDQRTKEVITTFTVEIINTTLAKSGEREVKIPINEEALSEALKDLESLVGLKKLKKEITDTVKLARYLNEQGEDIRKIFGDHILFLGNPGTGKTTVARIFSRIYSALGILPKGHLVETDRQGLVAGYVGQTAEKTTNLIDRALGGMLFIDEAYTFVKKGDSGSDFGKEAIDILLKRMEDDRRKFIVIAAGYTDEMNNFVASNPGIQSRFSKSFTFEDYSPSELLEIVDFSLKKENKRISKEAEEKLLNYFEEIYKNRDKKFGNARIVRNILESVKQKMLLRLSEIPANERTEEKTNTIELSDIQEVLNREVEAKQFEVKGDPLKLQEAIDELNNLIGLENVKQEVYKLISFAKISQLKKEKGLQSIARNLHSIFIGNEGTGKTTVAKLIGRIFKELGVLEKGHVIEVDRSDFVAGYQGQTAVKTETLIKQALGGTMFIRDAFTLFRDDDPFGQEAIETIIKKMEDYKGKLVLILSGTNEKMNKIIKIVPGITAYFPNIFHFEDYTPRQLLGIAANIAEKNGYTLDEGALQEMLDLFSNFNSNKRKNFQNGTTAKNILYAAITNQEERIFNLSDKADVDLSTLTLEDVQRITI